MEILEMGKKQCMSIYLPLTFFESTTAKNH